MKERERDALMGFDEGFDSLLKVSGFFNRGIVAEARSFYRVYVRKCYEYGMHLNFFEVLYVHLIAMGFKKRKIDKYLSKIRDGIKEYLRYSFPSGVNPAQNNKPTPVGDVGDNR